MNKRVLAFAVLIAALALELNAQGFDLPGEGRLHLDGRYRSLEDGAVEGAVAVHYLDESRAEAGWRLTFKDFPLTSGSVRGQHLAVGPLWGYATRTRVRLRFDLNAWFAVRANLTDVATATKLSLPYGADSSLHLYLPVRLGPAVTLFPSARVTGRGARRTRAAEPEEEKGWEWGGGWGAGLAVSLGKQSPLTLDAGYSRPWRATLLGDERWTAGVAWRL